MRINRNLARMIDKTKSTRGDKHRFYRIERKYVQHLKRVLKRAIENELVEQVKSIVSSNRISLVGSTTSLIQDSYSCSLVDSDPSGVKRKSSSSSHVECSLSTSDSVRRVKRSKLTKRIDWSRLYIDRDNKYNPLHYATKLGKVSLISVLLDSGYFQVNDTNGGSERDTALCIACDHGWIETSRLLIQRGADVNYENSQCKTPMIFSTELIHPFDYDLCSLLLSNGALVNQITLNMNTALLNASKFGNMQLIKLLVEKGANIHSRFNDGSTPFTRACYFNYPDLVNYFLRLGVDVNTQNCRLETPLFIAAFRGNLEIACILLNQDKVKIDLDDMDGDTPLSVACYENKPDIIELLIRHQARVNTAGIRGDTPLHIAVSNCGDQVVERLIERGAHVDALNEDNETPLYVMASRHSSYKKFQSLLRHAVNLDAESIKEHRTAFKVLIESKQIEKLDVAACLILAGCDVNKSFHRSALNTDTAFQHLLKIPRNRFKFFQQLHKNYSDDPILLLVGLLCLVLKAGHKVTEHDVRLYKQSWLRSYLNSRYPKMLVNLDNLFDTYSTQPVSLINLCKFRIRQLLKKPLNASIPSLRLPKDLEELLFLRN